MQYIRKTLENGLRVILVPLKDIETVTVMVLAQTGSEYEEKKQNGLAHFLEHMCFKGTTKRPTSKDISYEIDSLGAANNAFTSNDHTGYYAKAHSTKTAEILDIVADLYLNPAFPEGEIEKEKGVVIEEINMYEDRPQSKVWDVFGEAVFGDQPAGRNIAGTKQTVSSFTRSDLVAYHKKYYIPASTTLVIAGKIDEAALMEQVVSLFRDIPSGTKAEKPKVIDQQSAPKVSILNKQSDQTHIIIGFRTFITKYDEHRVYAAGMLSSVLGAGMSSRLFDKIREELGLAYYVGASHSPEMDYGMFTVRLGVSNLKAKKAIEAVFEELRKVKEELIPEEELRRVKERRRGHMFLGLETSDAWADFYGFQEMYHEKIETPEEVVECRDAVSAEDMMNIAKDIFRPENLTIAMVGPQGDETVFYDTIQL